MIGSDGFKKQLTSNSTQPKIIIIFFFQTQSINIWKPNNDSFLIPMAEPNVAQPQNPVLAQI